MLLFVVRLPAQQQTNSVQIPIETLANLPRGISLAELEARIRLNPLHQFAAHIDTNDFLCVSVFFEHPPGSFYFLFRDEKLTTVSKPPKAEFETKSYDGRRSQVPKRVEPEERLASVLSERDLSPSEIDESLKRSAELDAAATRAKEPQNIKPAWTITAPLWMAQRNSIDRAQDEAAKLVAKFDPFKVKLGMTVSEVERLFGKPARVRQISSNETLHVYGSDLPGFASVRFRPVWMTVVFRDQKVIRVFSHDLFDKRLLDTK
jgi:hypothetical protein